MRITRKDGDLTVQTIAGAYVVFFGMNLPKNKTAKFLGFAIQRKDVQTGEVIWMKGMKTFRETDPNDSIGSDFSSREHPYQSFQWADYTVKPGLKYSYKIVALRGTPTNLQETETVNVTVTTESEDANAHAIFFNRGAAASQEYARRFQNKKPNQAGNAAYTWLSRGLIEALTAFLEQANGDSYGILGAVYEFNWLPVLATLKQVSQTGAKVKIVYHAYDDETTPVTEAAIAEAEIKLLCKPRKNTLKIDQNKFFVLTKNGKPIQVWTGSTNISENGIYGHSNVGHIIRDKAVAQAYADYWEQLHKDTDGASMKEWFKENNPAPPTGEDYPEIFPVFSPHSGQSVLKWYAELANSAQQGLFMTFAFGMNKEFLKVYDQNDNVLRMALMDKKGMNDKAKAQVDKVRRLPNCIVAVGNNIKTNAFDRWLAEIYSIIKGPRVPYIHNKFMLVDPLGDNPVVITGSANFSEASTSTNDENMVVIRNDKRVADIFFGEYMRMYTHYAFRESLMFKPTNITDRSHLISNSSWVNDYYGYTSRSMRRKYFSGVEA
jgi:phosphatidylserine/phosphatidylglycerophosphate/cardiolipin synthase-like enzyme